MVNIPQHHFQVPPSMTLWVTAVHEKIIWLFSRFSNHSLTTPYPLTITAISLLYMILHEYSTTAIIDQYDCWIFLNDTDTSYSCKCSLVVCMYPSNGSVNSATILIVYILGYPDR